MPKKPAAIDTILVGAGGKAAFRARTVNPPVQRGSTVLLPNAASLYDTSQITYGLEGLEPVASLTRALAELEGAVGVQLYPTGLAAVTAPLAALVAAGDEVLVPESVYKPTRRFCDQVLARFGVGVRYYDPALTASELLALAGAATRVVLLESPGSLTFEMQDVPAIAAACRERGLITLIDNTWAAGLLFKPLAHGVDVSVQALTKYVGGHSDVFMGSAATAREDLAAILKRDADNFGWAVTPDDSYLMLRGLRTLPTRLRRHGDSALVVARWLEGRPEVARVLCPALPSDPGHAIWRRDFTGACGLFGLVLRPVSEARVHAFLDALRLFGLGFSWGGYESLAIHCDPQLKDRGAPLDLGGPLLRLHVGLEEPADLIADLEAGFAAMATA